MDSEDVRPFVPFVRWLVDEPQDSAAFSAALRHSTPEDRDFALEIIQHRKNVLVRRKAANAQRRAELRELYPGIEGAV